MTRCGASSAIDGAASHASVGDRKENPPAVTAQQSPKGLGTRHEIDRSCPLFLRIEVSAISGRPKAWGLFARGGQGKGRARSQKLAGCRKAEAAIRLEHKLAPLSRPKGKAFVVRNCI
jgi:hypothetical protein